jgi:hypothetical protein
MTDLKKCEICRLRKIKVIRYSTPPPAHSDSPCLFQCDKKRPKCDNCRKKSRHCYYRYDKSWTFVPEQPENTSGQALIARGSRTGSKKGSWHGFHHSVPIDPDSDRSSPPEPFILDELTPIVLSVPSPVSFTPQTALAARWVAMTGPRLSKANSANSLRPLGRWINTIPSYVGSTQTMDLAVTYFLDSCAAHLNGSEANIRSARASGAKALKSLRLAWAGTTPQQTDDILNLMLSIELHFAAEACRILHHCKGRTRLTSFLAFQKRWHLLLYITRTGNVSAIQLLRSFNLGIRASSKLI